MTGAAGKLHAEVKHVLSVVYSLGPNYIADFPPTCMQAAMDRLLQKVGVCVETLVGYTLNFTSIVLAAQAKDRKSVV